MPTADIQAFDSKSFGGWTVDDFRWLMTKAAAYQQVSFGTQLEWHYSDHSDADYHQQSIKWGSAWDPLLYLTYRVTTDESFDIEALVSTDRSTAYKRHQEDWYTARFKLSSVCLGDERALHPDRSDISAVETMRAEFVVLDQALANLDGWIRERVAAKVRCRNRDCRHTSRLETAAFQEAIRRSLTIDTLKARLVCAECGSRDPWFTPVR